MKVIKKMMAWLLILSMVMTLCPVSVKAASVNVTIALSKSSVKVGDSVTVTVSVKCSEAIGSYAMAVTYDSNVIEYSSGSGNGGGGTVNIAGYGDGSAKTLKATLKFKAVGSGSTKVATTGGEAYTWNEESVNISHAGATVTVAADVQASTENNLSSLSVSPGSLSPAFDPATTSYTVSVGSDVKELVVSAKAMDDKASVKVSGNKNLKAGQNTVKVTVTAESGDKKVYKIVCTKAQSENTTEEQTSTEEQNSTESTEATESSETEETTETSEDTTEEVSALSVLIEGVTYTFATEEDGVVAPTDFNQIVSAYQGSEIMAFAGPGEAVILVCLLDTAGVQTWFMYDAATGGFMKYLELNTKASRLFIMQAADDVVIPEGYRSVEVNMNGEIIPGYINESNSEILLVYAKTIAGDAGLYLYDTSENSYIRYIEDALAVEQEEVATVAPTTEEVAPVANNGLAKLQSIISYEILLLIVGVVSLMAIIFLAMSISFAVKLAAKDDQSDAEVKDSEEMIVAEKKTDEVQEASKTTDKKVSIVGSEVEQKAAELVSKLDLATDGESTETKSEQAPISQDTAPVPIINLGEEEK